MSKRRRRNAPGAEERRPAWQEAWARIGEDRLLRHLHGRAYPVVDHNLTGPALAVLDRGGTIRMNTGRPASREEWYAQFVHLLVHLGYGHHDIPPSIDPVAWNLAADIAADGMATRILHHHHVPLPEGAPSARSAVLTGADADRLLGTPALAEYARRDWGDLVVDERRVYGARLTASAWQSLFVQGMREMAADAIDGVADIAFDRGARQRTRAHRLLAWFMANYPLLSALAAGFEMVEDEDACRRLDVRVAAVEPSRRRIYLNPAAGLSDEELRFVIAHEILHVALMHEQRREGRDPYLWNVSCFPAGTWTGWGKPIEEVAMTSKRFTGDLRVIHSPASTVRCTPEHPFLVRRRPDSPGHDPLRNAEPAPRHVEEPEWIEAKDLDPQRDSVLVPAFEPGQRVHDTTIDLRPYAARGIRPGCPPVDRGCTEIPLDADVAWMIGLYVAEGAGIEQVSFALHEDDAMHAARLVETARRLGWTGGIRGSDAPDGMQVVIASPILARYLHDECGRDAHERHIPQVILRHADPLIRTAFLDGCRAGAGHRVRAARTRQEAQQVASPSEALINDVVLLLAQDGMGGSKGLAVLDPLRAGEQGIKEVRLHAFTWDPNEPAVTTRQANGRPLPSTSRRWHADEYGVWYRVEGIGREPFDGPVYNLETEEHTYIANGLLVHNCDYLINRWLVQMRVGQLPAVGVLYDEAYDDLSSEEIYARLAADVRRARKLVSLRGRGEGDILYGEPGWWTRGDGVRGEEWVRGALARGLDLHHRSKLAGRTPADLVDAIEAIAQPPVPWDAQMAEWFQARFPPRQIGRTYARASRRQSASPDIVRPGRAPRDPNGPARVFAVVVDTSGSMTADDLGRACGAIMGYAVAHEVDAIRKIDCDAAAYDAGWIDPYELLGRVRMRGGGGTVLQPALDLLERLDDLPADAPVMILTDGCYEERLRTMRDHCYVMPADGWVLHPTDGPVFRMD